MSGTSYQHFKLHPHNRHAGAKVLRSRWQAHIDASLSRPVLTVDESQEVIASILVELRLPSSTRLDSHLLVTVVLAGDQRLTELARAGQLVRDADGYRLARSNTTEVQGRP